MKKHFLKSFALLAMLFSALTLSAQSGVDWSVATSVIGTEQYKVAIVSGEANLQFVNNIQKPGFASEEGIHIVFTKAITECSLVNGTGCATEGGGMIMYLSALTARETKVIVKFGTEETILWVYNADGTTGGSSEPETPDTEAPTLENVELFGAAQNFVLLTPTATDNKGVTSYVIAQNGGAETEVTPDASTGQIKITGLTLNKTYTYSVKAKDAAGNVSAAKEITFSTLDNVFCEEEVLPTNFFTKNQKLTFTAKKINATQTLFELTSTTSTLTGVQNANITNAAGGGFSGDPKLATWELDSENNKLSKTITWSTYPTSPITMFVTALRTPGAGESNMIEISYTMDISNTCSTESEPEEVESNYCQKQLTVDGIDIYLTAVMLSKGNYRLTVEGETVERITGTHYNPGGVHIGGLTPVKTTGAYGNKVVYDIEADSDPIIYNPLMVWVDNKEVNFGSINDIVWGTCPESDEPSDTEAPTMISATVESYNHNSAVIAVDATDNVGVVRYHVVDETNNIDEKKVATDGKISLSGLVSATEYNLTITALDAALNESTEGKVVTFTTSSLQYCDYLTGHMGNANYDDPNGRCLLSITKISDTRIRVTVKNTNDATAKIDILRVYVAPNEIIVGEELSTGGYDQMSADIEHDGTLPRTCEIQWSNVGNDGGRWNIPNIIGMTESNLCSDFEDNTKPEMLDAKLISNTTSEALIEVSASDNDLVAKYHVIDVENNIDEYYTANASNQITIENLTSSIVYTFTITAIDAAGNESDNSKSVTVTTSQLEYCEWLTGHLGNANWGDINGRCLLTISKVTEKQLLVVVKPVSGANKLDFLQIQADGAPHQTIDLSGKTAADELSCVLDFANTITEIPLFRFLWSNEGVAGNWQVDLTNVKASYLCPYVELGESVDLSKLDLSAGVTTDVKITRKFVKGSGKWNTLSLPFGLNATDIATAFGSAKVVELSGATLVTSNDIDLSVTEVSAIAAGKPYLIQLPATYAPAVIENITLSNTVTAQETATANGLAKMVSVLTPIAFDDAAGGIRFFLNTNGKLSYRSTTNGIMNPYRAYFEFPHINDPATASQVRARVVFNENTETGVDNLITTDAPAKVIENGQLIIIRGGVKYNVQGQKL